MKTEFFLATAWQNQAEDIVHLSGSSLSAVVMDSVRCFIVLPRYCLFWMSWASVPVLVRLS